MLSAMLHFVCFVSLNILTLFHIFSSKDYILPHELVDDNLEDDQDNRE